MAYHQLEPWGEERADLRAGIIASTLANINRDPKRHPEPYGATDFMPYHQRDQAAAETVTTPEARSASIRALLSKKG